MFSLAKPPEQPQQTVEQEVPKSAYYLQLKTQSNVAVLTICFGVGAIATNVIRLFPAYYVLYVLASIFGIVALLAFPSADPNAKYLWRWGAIALLGGLLLPWWELLHLVPKWVWGAILAGVFAVVIAIGGM